MFGITFIEFHGWSSLTMTTIAAGRFDAGDVEDVPAGRPFRLAIDDDRRGDRDDDDGDTDEQPRASPEPSWHAVTSA